MTGEAKGRVFTVVISHKGVAVSVCDVTALLPDEAVDEAWARFEAEQGPINLIDPDYAITVRLKNVNWPMGEG
jgi:hypothetical protein